MDSSLRDLIWRRAAHRCEYCGLHQDDIPFTKLHVEHVVPRKHGGDSSAENLALACVHCNLHKGTNLTGIDPDDGTVTRLFHPRQDRWSDHFQNEGAMIVPSTPVGRTTVRVLNMNAQHRVRLRDELIKAGRL